MTDLYLGIAVAGVNACVVIVVVIGFLAAGLF